MLTRPHVDCTIEERETLPLIHLPGQAVEVAMQELTHDILRPKRLLLSRDEEQVPPVGQIGLHRCKALGPAIRESHPSDLEVIKNLLLESSHLYPGIDHWWDNRVAPDIATGRRVVLVAVAGAGIEGVFIGKSGRHSKLCTLRLRQGVRNQGLGMALVAIGLRDLIRHGARDIHVTVSEAAESSCSMFFEALGFRRIAVARDRYVPDIDEFVYSCPAPDVCALLRDDLLPRVMRAREGAAAEHGPSGEVPNLLLMSLKPHFADLFMQGRKSVELRRRFSEKYTGAQVLFYVSSPVCQFSSIASVSRVEHMSTSDLWSEHRENVGISKEAFDQYFAGVGNGYAITMKDFRVLTQQVSLQAVRLIYPWFMPPQSFRTLESGSILTRLLNSPAGTEV